MVEAGGAVPPRELLWVFLRLHSRGVWEHRQNLLRKSVMLILMSQLDQVFVIIATGAHSIVYLE